MRSYPLKHKPGIDLFGFFGFIIEKHINYYIACVVHIFSERRHILHSLHIFYRFFFLVCGDKSPQTKHMVSVIMPEASEFAVDPVYLLVVSHLAFHLSGQDIYIRLFLRFRDPYFQDEHGGDKKSYHRREQEILYHVFCIVAGGSHNKYRGDKQHNKHQHIEFYME